MLNKCPDCLGKCETEKWDGKMGTCTKCKTGNVLVHHVIHRQFAYGSTDQYRWSIDDYSRSARCFYDVFSNDFVPPKDGWKQSWSRGTKDLVVGQSIEVEETF